MPLTTSSAPAKPTASVRFQYDLATRRAMGLAFQLCYMIAVPAFFFGFAGAYLDKYLGTGGLMLFLGLAVSLTISARWVIRYVRSFVKHQPSSAIKS